MLLLLLSCVFGYVVNGIDRQWAFGIAASSRIHTAHCFAPVISQYPRECIANMSKSNPEVEITVLAQMVSVTRNEGLPYDREGSKTGGLTIGGGTLLDHLGKEKGGPWYVAVVVFQTEKSYPGQLLFSYDLWPDQPSKEHPFNLSLFEDHDFERAVDGNTVRYYTRIPLIIQEGHSIIFAVKPGNVKQPWVSVKTTVLLRRVVFPLAPEPSPVQPTILEAKNKWEAAIDATVFKTKDANLFYYPIVDGKYDALRRVVMKDIRKGPGDPHLLEDPKFWKDDTIVKVTARFQFIPTRGGFVISKDGRTAPGLTISSAYLKYHLEFTTDKSIQERFKWNIVAVKFRNLESCNGELYYKTEIDEEMPTKDKPLNFSKFTPTNFKYDPTGKHVGFYEKFGGRFDDLGPDPREPGTLVINGSQYKTFYIGNEATGISLDLNRDLEMAIKPKLEECEWRSNLFRATSSVDGPVYLYVARAYPQKDIDYFTKVMHRSMGSSFYSQPHSR